MSILFSKKQKDYGVNYQEHLFEQYKIYIESTEKISDRRQNANNFFLTSNTILISIISLSFQIELLSKLEWIKIILALLGLFFCVIFWFLLNSYKQLNSGKFKIIHEIEQNLPLKLYSYEWIILGKGKNKKLYYPFSHVELLIPWIFGFIYIILLIVFIFSM